MKIDILGTQYQICRSDYKEDSYFAKKNASGFCDSQLKILGLCNMKTYPGFEEESPEFCAAYEREVLRHEIVHAFFAESGLGDNANNIDGAWPLNEEMIDWIALQGPKLYAAWQAAGAL